MMDDGEMAHASGTPGSGEAQPRESEALLRQSKSMAELARERSQVVVPEVLGADEETARRITSEAACQLRVARRDQERFPLTLDYQPSRITVEIEGGQVASAKVG
jgi:hypothetical protein